MVSSIPMLYRYYTDATCIEFGDRLGGGRVWQLSSVGHLPNSLLYVLNAIYKFTYFKVRGRLEGRLALRF